MGRADGCVWVEGACVGVVMWGSCTRADGCLLLPGHTASGRPRCLQPRMLPKEVHAVYVRASRAGSKGLRQRSVCTGRPKGFVKVRMKQSKVCNTAIKLICWTTLGRLLN